jgi:ParB-like chromosome segregation protein Spo0J
MLRLQGKLTTIPLDELDTSPGPYTMSFGFDLNPMMESIRRVGLLNPPLADRDEEGRARIVVGYRRVLAVRGMGQRELLCIDLSGARLSPLDKLLLNLHDNLATRDLNGPEKGMALERLLTHFPEQEVIDRYMPLLGLPAHGPLLGTYVRIGVLEEEIRAAFAAGRLSFQTVRALLDMDPPSRKGLGEWLLSLQFNFNQQIQFIDMIKDISSISDIAPHEVLLETALIEILEKPSMNGPQKVKSALDTLRARRLPSLVAAEKKFRKTVHGLRLPDGVRLHHSPFFESPDFRLEICFREGKVLRRRLAELASTDDLEKIKEPWEE